MSGRMNTLVRLSMLSAIVLGGLVSADETLDFSLSDSLGRRVNSQDYRGRPVLLVFGTCW